MLSYAHAHPLGSVELGEGFSRVPTIPDPTPLTVFSSGRVPTVQRLVARKSIFLLCSWRYPSSPSPASKTFMFLGVAGGTIERSCYSPHYVNTERDYERDYQATLPQGRTAADGCKPRHGRDDRKRERSFSGLRQEIHRREGKQPNSNLRYDCSTRAPQFPRK